MGSCFLLTVAQTCSSKSLYARLARYNAPPGLRARDRWVIRRVPPLGPGTPVSYQPLHPLVADSTDSSASLDPHAEMWSGAWA